MRRRFRRAIPLAVLLGGLVWTGCLARQPAPVARPESPAEKEIPPYVRVSPGDPAGPGAAPRVVPAGGMPRIEGLIFADRDGDARGTAPDLALGHRTVRLYRRDPGGEVDPDRPLQTVAVGGDGRFAFEVPGPGVYLVAQDRPPHGAADSILAGACGPGAREMAWKDCLPAGARPPQSCEPICWEVRVEECLVYPIWLARLWPLPMFPRGGDDDEPTPRPSPSPRPTSTPTDRPPSPTPGPTDDPPPSSTPGPTDDPPPTPGPTADPPSPTPSPLADPPPSSSPGPTADPPTGCGNIRTVTLGGWGSTPAGSNPGTWLQSSFPMLYPASPGLRVGTTSSLTFTSSTSVGAFLRSSQSGPPGVLSASFADPTVNVGTGVFGKQVVTLRLNIDFSAQDLLPGETAGDGMHLGDLVIAPGAPGGLSYFAGLTVQQLETLSEAVLGGLTTPSGLATAHGGATVSDLNDAVDRINNAAEPAGPPPTFLLCPGS